MHRFVVLLVLLVPLAGAQSVQHVTWSGTWATDPVSVEACDGSAVDLLGAHAFRFSEDALAAGCGEAHLDLRLPKGVGSLEVAFTADRSVEGTALGPREMPQQVVFQAAGQEDVRDVFPPEAGDRDAEAMAFRYDVPDGLQDVRVSWTFADRGVVSGLGGEALTASVRDLEIRVEGVAADVEVRPSASYIDGDALVTVYGSAFELPGGVEKLRISLSDWDPSLLRGPDTAIWPDEMTVTREGAATTLTVPGDRLDGPGTYVVQGRTTEPAPAPPIDGIHPAVWALLGLPLLLGTLSMQGATRFYLQAPHDRRKDGMRLLVQNVTLAVGYVVLLVTAYLARDRLVASRFSSSTWLLLAQMGVVSLAFLALWQLGARQMTHRLQADIAKAEEEERHLRQLNDELRRSNEDLERFARIASHDLKEPLRSVQFHTEKVAARYAPQLDERGRKSLELAAGGARRMRHLVDGISAYSSVEQRMERPERFESREAVEAVVSALEALIRERQATVELGSLAPMVGHRDLIEQALQNLITNAIKHCSPGVHIQVRGRQSPGRFILEVQDDGPGIPEEYHERIFEVFQRLEGRTEEGGTGMGLAIVKRIAELHEGTAGLKSQPGHGATFYLEIPDKQGNAHGDIGRRRQ